MKRPVALVSLVPNELFEEIRTKPAPIDLNAREADSEAFVREAFRANRIEYARSVSHKFGISQEAVGLMAQGTCKATRAIVRVKAFMERDHERGLILAGSVGTGKTFAAAYAWLNKPPGSSAILIKSPDLRQSVSPWKGEGKAVDLRSRLVIVDDLGTERCDEHWQIALQKLIDSRVGSESKTIITTNLTGAQLRQKYNLRTIDRMRTYAFCALSGDSMRKRPR